MHFDRLFGLKSVSITRQIEFGVCHIFLALTQFNNVPARGNIYQSYRVFLALVEAKHLIVQRSITVNQPDIDNFEYIPASEDFISTMKTFVCVPDQIYSIINAIGKVKTNDRVYVPQFGRCNHTRNERFIPQSEQITYSNLRRTVLALSNDLTPLEYRRRFYRNNPIPGARWENHLLLNPNDIMPANYNLDDLRDDLDAVQPKMLFLNRKAPKYFTHLPSFEPESSKSMLSYNDQETLRVSNCGDNLDRYNEEQLKLEGDVS